MKYLLDTNVVSALRVRGRDRAVEAWAASVPLGDQFVSAFTVAEIERDVVAKERADAAQGVVLRRWFEGNVLPRSRTASCRSTCQRPGLSLDIGFLSTRRSTTPSSRRSPIPAE